MSDQLYHHGELHLRRPYLNMYLDCGGRILSMDSCTAEGSAFSDCFFDDNVDSTPEILLHTQEMWTLDTFSPTVVCMIGICAYKDLNFRARVQRKLSDCLAPMTSGQLTRINNIFNSNFDTNSIVDHLEKMYLYSGYLTKKWLGMASASKSKPLIEAGIDLDQLDIFGHAAAAGNMDVVMLLLEAGANSALAISRFLCESDTLSNAIFKHILELLIKNATPEKSEHNDLGALCAILHSERAISACPEAPEILFDKGIFDHNLLAGNENHFYYLDDSYMGQAIEQELPHVVGLILQNGARANVQIGQLFRCSDFCFMDNQDPGPFDCLVFYTWLTYAVEYGAASCANALLYHGADVTASDGAGRSAISMALSTTAGPHPRTIRFNELCRDEARPATMEQDAETLAVVRRAFDLKFQGQISMEDYIASEATHDVSLPSQPETTNTALYNYLEKILKAFLAPEQLEHIWKYTSHWRRAWSLSFLDAMLMRSLYVLSYMILLVIELSAFIRGEKRISMPSRGLLSVVAVLLLATIWGSAQFGFSWTPTIT